jgi:hypothetical protein
MTAFLTCAAAACCLAATSLPLQRPATGAIHGVVLDTRGGTPVGRVAVRLQATGQSVVTDDQGRFEINGVPGGEQELSVSAVDFILVKQSVAVRAGAVADVTIVLSEGTGRYAETVTVVGASAPRDDPATSAEQTLRGNELQQLGSVLANDPMRAIQTMPGVVAGDDFRSDFAIRGAGVDRTSFVFEGISTDFLLHTPQELRNSASIAMINGDVLDEVAVANGAYPQRHGNRIGAEVDFRMRDGSREQAKSETTISLIDASSVAEGPLGTRQRGAWLVAGRASYLDLVAQRLYPDQADTVGFSDAQAKLTFDVNAHQRVQFALTAGRSQFQGSPVRAGEPVVNVEGDVMVANSSSRSAIGVLWWRYQPSSRFSFTQRVAADVNVLTNVDVASGHYTDDAHDFVTRTEWSYAPRASVAVEGGGEARWSAASGSRPVIDVTGRSAGYAASTVGVSAFALARLTSPTGAALVPGVRIDHWSLTSDTSASPWIAGSMPISHALTLRAGGGIYRQEPSVVELQGFGGNPALAPERAYHLDVGLEGRLSPTLGWHATAYNREDRGLLDSPELGVRVVRGFLGLASPTDRFENALDGYARGVELTLARRSPNGLSGWISYALGFNHYRDRTTGDAFWGDYDQRHTVNAFGAYRVSDRLSFSAHFRAGSNIPTAGYWTERGGADFVGDTRNTLRVPVYSRLDARMNRTFQWNQKRLTLFLEALNVYDRANVRAQIPNVNNHTLQATQLYAPMLPLLPSIGARLEF